MTATKSIQKPTKPYPEFPLFAHARGYWAKKFKGRQYNCGPWADPDAALKRWEGIRNDLQLGIAPTTRAEGVTTVEDVINCYLDAKDAAVQSGDLSMRTFRDYKSHGKWLVDNLGRYVPAADLTPAHFTALRKKFPESWGYVAIKKHVNAAKMIFKWAAAEQLIPHPLNYGSVFKIPPKKRHKVERRAKPKRLFTAAEIWRLIGAAGNPQLKAMIMLGVNAAFLNVDCARLRLDDIGGEFLDVPRGKNENDRRAWLWPETRRAIDAAIESANDSSVPPKSDAADLVFRTHHGQMWSDETSGGCAIVQEFTKIKSAAGVDRHGVGFAALRHVFRTVADETLDIPAVRLVMGHDDGSMDNVYREDISEARTKAVCQHVRKWFLAAKPKGGAK